jgi:hypothetical protein
MSALAFALALSTTVLSTTAHAAPVATAEPPPAPTRIDTTIGEGQRDDLDKPQPDINTFHGARIGYVLSLGAEEYGYSAHNLAMGYEWFQVIDAGSRVDFLTVQNVVVIGINQGLFIPAANAIVGIEVDETLQLGVGANLNLGAMMVDGQALGMVAAVGLVLDAGDVNVPVHLSAVPQREGPPRLALTTGVNW